MNNRGKLMLSVADVIKAINHGCLGIFNIAYSCISREIKYADHLACQKLHEVEDLTSDNEGKKEEALGFSQQDNIEEKYSLNEEALDEAIKEKYSKAYERIESIIAEGGSIFCLYRKWYKHLQEAAEIR